MNAHRLLADQSGAAAAEMALLVPLLLTLMFGGFEAGHFIWSQHKITEAVRDGARFAGRLPIDEICPTSGSMSPTTRDEIALLTRTGQIANASAQPKVPGWLDSQVTVEAHCEQFVGTGIYSDYGRAGPIITVKAVVDYPSLLHGLGIQAFGNIDLSASTNAPVIGL